MSATLITVDNDEARKIISKEAKKIDDEQISTIEQLHKKYDGEITSLVMRKKLKIDKINKQYDTKLNYFNTQKNSKIEDVKKKSNDKINEMNARFVSYLEKKDPASLYNALIEGRLEECKFLLKNKLVTDLEYSVGANTPLILAIHYKYFDLAKLLIESGANVNALDYDENSVLNKLVLECSDNEESVDIAHQLINAGADINSKNNNVDNTVLHNCIRNFSPSNSEIFKLLIKCGANIEATTKRLKSTPLIYAAVKNTIECVMLLLDANANVNYQNADGNTALHYVAQNNSADSITITKMLLTKNADKNIKNKNGFIPFDLAVYTTIKNLLDIKIRSVFIKDNVKPDDLMDAKFSLISPIKIKARKNGQWADVTFFANNLVFKIPKNDDAKLEYHVLPAGSNFCDNEPYLSDTETYVKFPSHLLVGIGDNHNVKLGSIYRLD